VWHWSMALLKNGLDAVTIVQRFLKERKEKRVAAEEDEMLPQVIQWMDETEQKIRRRDNLHSYVPVFDDEEWWTRALLGVPRRLIRRAMQKRREMKKRIDDLYNR
jgi:hypothetical protein